MVTVDIGELNTPLIHGAGTPEEVWRSCGLLEGLPESWIPERGLAVVLAPHPDDEALGLGGTLRRLLTNGMTVIVVTATDGEASHPLSTTTSPRTLRQIRRNESRKATRALAAGTKGTMINVALHLPDGQLADFEDELSGQLAKYLDRDALLFATWDQDGHPDHDAAGRVARQATETHGLQLRQYPIWTWHWAEPSVSTIPWSRARRVSLSDADLAAKRNAIACYRSQIYPLSERPGDEAVVPPFDLAHFQRPFEVIFE